MTNRRRIALLLSGALCLVVGLLGAMEFPAGATNTKGKVTVTHAMIPVPTNPTTGAVYMTIHNGTSRSISIVGVSIPSSIAGMAMPMKEVLRGQTETMVNVPQIAIPAGKTLRLAPGNYHVMLEEMKTTLSRGTKVPLTLHLSNGTTVSVTATVVPLSVAFAKGGTAPTKSSGTSHSNGDMGGMSGMKGMQ